VVLVMNDAGPGGLELRCHVRRSALIALIEVAGVLRLDTVPRLRQAVLKVLTDSPEAIVLDLGGVDAVEDELSLLMFATLGRLVTDRAESALVLAAPSLRLRVALHRAAPLFVQVFPTRAEAWLAAEQGVSRRRVSEALPPTPHAPRSARRLVDEMCIRWHLGSELRDRAQLVVTELVTNAVEHAGSGIELIVTVRRHVLRIEVCDDNDVLPHPQHSPPDTPGGDGLRLVTRLASHWGSKPTSRGKLIWADLVITPPHTETLTGHPHHQAPTPSRDTEDQDHTGHLPPRRSNREADRDTDTAQRTTDTPQGGVNHPAVSGDAGVLEPTPSLPHRGPLRGTGFRDQHTRPPHSTRN
jgi:anti-sigma regulatory factor (Ser/Thr protein kinase)/anti-anti-sigma regulatory factor